MNVELVAPRHQFSSSTSPNKEGKLVGNDKRRVSKNRGMPAYRYCTPDGRAGRCITVFACPPYTTSMLT
jgi:hypothetical protein